jgi:hypothetical protein
MSTVQEIKAAAFQLSPREQLELSEWLANSESVRNLRLEELRRDLAIGVAQADRGELRDSREVFRKLRQNH